MKLLLVAYICPIFRENKPDSAQKQCNSPEDSVETWDFIIFSSDEISETSDEISKTSEKISKTSEKMIIYHEKHTESTQKGVENIA
ncbi:MAG: hypothetical protein D8H91_01190 [Alloprevotella sp.]|nr:MAG: hypothetical protein D8H91_01190 [Alloprevotella sp.]